MAGGGDRRLLTIARAAVGLVVLLLVQAALAGAASAATITVTTTSDETAVDGQVSLREAIQSIDGGANVNADVSASGTYGTNDTIILPGNTSHYMVSVGELPITKPVLIQGAGASSSIVDAGGSSRVFHIVNPGVTSTQTVTFEGMTITGGKATTGFGGGALLADGSTGFLNFAGVTVSNNTATLSVGTANSDGGGGIYTGGNTLTVTNSTFSGNTSTVTTTTGCCHGGGAIFSDSGDIRVTNSTFTGNTATVTASGSSSLDGGGAIHQQSGALFVTGSTLTGNATTVTGATGCCHGGGAIYNDGSSGDIGVSLADSTVGGTGAAANTATIGTSSTRAGFEAGGGGIFNESEDLILDGSTITGNSTTVFSTGCCSGGGGVYQNGFNTSMTGATISGNNAVVNDNNCCDGGGGFYSDTSDATLTESVVSGNTTNVTAGSCCGGGGGIYNDGGVLTLTRSTVGNTSPGASGTSGGNSATLTSAQTEQGGGGIFDDGNGDILNASTVSDNVAHFTATPTASGGGGIYTFSPAFYSNSTISDNSTDAPAGTDEGGGGVYTDGSKATLASVTLAGNAASAAAGGGVFNTGSTLSSHDTIIAANSSGAGNHNCAGTSTPIFQSSGYNLEDSATDQCGFTGTGDLVNTNPKLSPLATNGGPTLTRQLMSGSPAINAGDPSGCTSAFGLTLSTDQRGILRVGRCDIGAYEFAPPVNTSPPAISGTTVQGQTLKCLIGSWSGSPITGYAYQWNRDGKAIPGATSAMYTVTASDPGHTVTCTVTATNVDGSTSATSAAVSVPVIPTPVPGSPPRVFVVSTASLAGQTVKFAVLCVATSGQTCKVVVTLTALEHLRRGKVVAVSSRVKRVVVGTATVLVSAGNTRTVSVKLNGTGRKLLARFGKLPVTAVIKLIGPTGQTLSVITTKFTVQKPHRKR